MNYTQQPEPPSWTVPILFGAVACLLTQGLPSMVALAGGSEGYVFAATAGCCCGGFGSLPLGFVTALVAFRRDATMLPVHGFSVAFIGVGLGHALLAMLQYFEFRKVDLVEVELILRDSLNEGLQEQQGTVLLAEDIDMSVDMLMSAMSWAWAATAGGATILAALFGLVTVAILRARRSRTEAAQ